MENMKTLPDDDGLDQLRSFPATTDEQENNIFSNGVVWRTLAKCLSFTDLKALRLVSHQFNQQVVTETNFRQRALVNLTLENSTRQKELFTNPNYFTPWKHFKIDLLCAINIESSDNNDCLDNLNISSNNSTSGNISSSNNDNGKNDQESVGANIVINETSTTPNNNDNTNNNNDCDNPIEENVWFYSLLKSADSLHIGIDKVDYYLPIELTLPLLFKIIEAPNSLKSLKLDLAILKRESSHVMPLSLFTQKVQKTLENLQEFSIFSYNDNTILPFQTEVFGTGLMKNLKIIKIMSDLEQDLDYDLLRLRNNKRYLTEEEEDDEEEQQQVQGTVTEKVNLKIPKLLQLIELNRTTLTTLHLEHPQLWSNVPTMTLIDGNLNTWDPITKKHFPLLKNVVIRVNEIESKGIIEFIERQPFLQEIDITILNLFPIQLLYVIADKSKKLKRLRIKTKGFRNSVSNMWDFLKSSQIEDFQLDFVFSDRFSPNGTVCQTIFPNLPSTISKLTLRRFPDIGFLNSTQLKFINPTLLTHLILKKSAYLVYDNTLEFIFKNFKMLQVLELNECVNCSDYGVTGLDENSKESKFSVTNLKGLKSLTITGCLFISDESCFAIKFKELKYLDLSSNQCITAVGIHEILRNNPSLEILKTSEYDESLNEEVRLWHPRFQKYIFTGGSSDSDCGEGSLLGFRLSNVNAELSQSSDDEEEDYAHF